MELSLSADALDPTLIVVGAWIIVAVGLTLWYLLRSAR